MFVTKDFVVQRSMFKGSLVFTVLFFLMCLLLMISTGGIMDGASVCFGAVLACCADTFTNLLEMLYCRLSGRTIGQPFKADDL